MEKDYEYNSFWSHDVTTRTDFKILHYYNPESLIKMIEFPMEYNKQLREVSRKLYSSQGIVRNTIDYITSLPTLDYVVTNYSKDSKSKTNKETMSYVLNLMRHKEFMRDVILKGCIDGIALYYFDTSKRKDSKAKSISIDDAYDVTEINSLKKALKDINISIINLPVDYCRIISIKNNSYVIAFNLEYFNEGTERCESKLSKFPTEFIEAYDNWRKGTGKQMFVLDNTKTIVHKISSNRDEPWGRPLVLAAIIDILFKDYFKNTKRKLLNDINNQIIYETFPEGKVIGTSSLTTKQQEAQHNAVKSAIQNKTNIGGTTFFSVAAGTKIDSISIDTDLFDDDGYESNLDTNIGTDLGFAASLLNASGTTSFSAQQTNLELVTSQIFQWIEAISNELNKVINHNILNYDYIETKVNYLPITHLNRKSSFEYAKELFTIGRGSLGYLANCAGLSEEVFFAMLDEQLESGVLDKYPVNATSYNTSGDNQGGRPTVDNPTNENTVRSKTNNSNEQPKPNV